MQDLQRLLGGGERRLKTQNQQALKCPRCDSLNTKFCYYNNYNLSQPRFFCKGCRRYWTNGGVLRNVPVGGGCRKNKRSKQKSGNGNPSLVSVAPTSELKSSDSQNSCSDSSPTFTPTPFTLSEGTPTLFSPNQRFDPPLLDTKNRNVFSEMGTFESLITSCSDQIPLDEDDMKIDRLNSFGFVGEVEYSRPSNHVGVTAEEEVWGLFDQSYWLNNFDHQSN